jgi:hypothetical protein
MNAEIRGEPGSGLKCWPEAADDAVAWREGRFGCRLFLLDLAKARSFAGFTRRNMRQMRKSSSRYYLSDSDRETHNLLLSGAAC